MFNPSTLLARSLTPGMPQACQSFSVHSNVCVGDLIAIAACSIAGIGFVAWAIHAIRKMRQFPFKYPDSEDIEKPIERSERVDPYHVSSTFNNSRLVQRGVVQTPTLPERVRTRLALSESEEDFYRQSTPISSDTYPPEGSKTTSRTPRRPPPAGRQSWRTPSHRPDRHGSPTRGGGYGERYEYGVNGEYLRNVSPSRARGSPLHRSGSGYRSHGSTKRTSGDATIHAY